MLSDTLAWRRLPARRRSAAADSRIVEAILEFLAKVPSTDRHRKTFPGTSHARSPDVPPRRPQ